MKTVLIVEDDQDIREFETMVLEHAGYEVYQAEDGLQALEILQRATLSPCLVLLDMMMPRMDGAAFLQELRDAERFSQIPVVLITAMPLDRPIPGVERVVSKPISMAALIEVVAEVAGPP